MNRNAAGAGVSTVLGVVVALLTNVYTDGWWWPVGVGLGCAVVLWVGWEMWRAARAGNSDAIAVEHTGAAVADGSASVANTGLVGRVGGVGVNNTGNAKATRGGTANTGVIGSEPGDV
jgi:hypothetical protein